MSRKPHDDFAKQYLKGLLEPVGTAEISLEIPGETQQVDVWFAPSSNAAIAPQALGLLGRMVTTACLLEPFRNPASWTEICSCLSKLFALQAEERRNAKRARQRLAENQTAYLWIMVPTASETLLEGFGAKPDQSWLEGTYLLPRYYRTGLVAIHQLPAIPDTLWLRLLGRGTVQAQAILELTNLPAEHPLRQPVLEYLAKLQVNLQSRQNLSRDERELAMNLTPLYEQWREQTLQEGRQEELKSLLEARFGVLDVELSRAATLLLQMSKQDRTRLLLQLSTLSRESLLEQVQGF